MSDMHHMEEKDSKLARDNRKKIVRDKRQKTNKENGGKCLNYHWGFIVQLHNIFIFYGANAETLLLESFASGVPRLVTPLSSIENG